MASSALSSIIVACKDAVLKSFANSAVCFFENYCVTGGIEMGQKLSVDELLDIVDH